MSWSKAAAVRLLFATLVAGFLAPLGTFAQEEKKDEKKPNEKTAGKYQYLEIPAPYDIRVPPRIDRLNELYRDPKTRKTLTAEESKLRSAEMRRIGEARGRRNEAFKKVRQILEGEQSIEQNPRALAYWFEGILFPEMTQFDDATFQELPKLRSNFFRDYTQRPRLTEAGHAYVVSTTLANMKYIAEHNFHPGIRYHAMLMIGELNSREAVLLGTAKSPPTPYATALPVLLDTYKNDKQIEAVKVAALLGILRHAELLGSNMRPENRDQIIDVMLATLTAPAGSRTASGHAWIQRRAVDILGKLKHVGTGGEVAKQLMDILLDEKASLAMRCSAAVAYGNLDFNAGTDPQVAKFAAVLGEMIAAECRMRLDWLTAEQEVLKKLRLVGQGYESGASSSYDGTDGGVITADGGSGLPLGPGEYGSGSASGLPMLPEGDSSVYGMEEVDPEKAATELEKHRLKALRRRLKYPIFCAQLALGGELQRNGNVGQRQDWKLKSFLKTKADSDFVVDLADSLNALQLATNAGIEKKDDKKVSSATSFTATADKDAKLSTAEFKDELLVAVRKVEETLRKAPASARPAPPADESPAPVGPVGPTPPSGPTGPAPAPAPAPAPGPAPGPAPAGPAPGPPAGA